MNEGRNASNSWDIITEHVNVTVIVEAIKPNGYIAIRSYYGHIAIQPYGFMDKIVAIMDVY